MYELVGHHDLLKPGKNRADAPYFFPDLRCGNP